MVQVVLLRTHPEVTNNLLMISLGKHLSSAGANTGVLITCKLFILTALYCTALHCTVQTLFEYRVFR